MAITIRRPLSNKPPKVKGLKKELEANYPTKVTYSDGFVSYVSKPILDRIALIVPLDPADIDEKFAKGGAGLAYGAWCQQVMSNLYNDADADPKKSKLFDGKKLVKQVALKIGSETAVIQILKTPQQEKRRLRFEFCPAKLSVAGATALNEKLCTATQSWDINAARKKAHITYLETGADLAFFEPAELVVWSDAAKFVVQFKGADGALETEYGATSLTIANKPLFGKPVYRMYDKTRQLQAVGLKPPLGDNPITRVEICKRWTSNAPLLLDIKEQPNPFDDLRVAYVRHGDQAKLTGWADFVFLRRFLSVSQAKRRLGFDDKLSGELEAAFKALPFNAFDRSTWWADWSGAVTATGIDQFLMKPMV